MTRQPGHLNGSKNKNFRGSNENWRTGSTCVGFSSKDHARTIQQALEKKYRVFLDFDELNDGVFDQRIMDAISHSSVFLLLLTKGALDRCSNEDDWVRKEILYASECSCHIVPVTIDDPFDGYPSDLPKEIQDIVGAHQFSELQTRKLFKPSMELLIRDRIKPHVRHEDDQSGTEIHIETDADCDLYRFKTFVKRLQAGVDNVVYLKPGNYKLDFISTEFSEVKENQKYSLSAEIKCDYLEVYLKDKEEAKRKAEEEARRIAEEKRKAEEEARRIAEEKRQAEERGEFTIEGVAFKMIHVEGGTFMMGANEGDSEAFDREKPTHQVTLSSYSIGETAVTQALWKAVMDNNPSRFKGADRPVENVSWDDCQEFIRKLNEKTNRKFRLPTEAEWEFAARGGNKSKGYKYAGSNDIDSVAWYDGNSGGKTHPVAQKQPNELGLYDMSGNVWEWCQDWYGEYSNNNQTNSTGPKSGSFRVLRGGSWYFSARICRVSYRYYNAPDNRDSYLGLRLAQ